MMRVSGYPKKAMYTMFIGAGFNVVLTPIFIFVLGLGIRGTAISTVISMCIGMLFVMHHFVQPNSLIRLKKKYIRFDWAIIAAIVTIGLSPFLMQVASTFVAVLMNAKLLKYGGDLAVGAFSIYNSIAMLIVMVVIGLNQGMQPVIGYNYGAQDYVRVRATLYYGLKVATVITSIGFLMGMFLPKVFANIFTADPYLLGITERGIRIATLAFPVIGFQIVVSNYFQSIGQAKKSIILSLSRQILFLIPALWILPEFFALDGVWAAGPISDVISGVLSACFLAHQIRILNGLIDKPEL
jgi:Na+-driven multidrug efflux pump